MRSAALAVLEIAETNLLILFRGNLAFGRPFYGRPPTRPACLHFEE
jgi:hypothetical protein